MSTRCLLLVGGAQTPEFGRAARRRGFETLVLLSEDEHVAGIGGDEFEHRERVDVDRPQSAILRRILDLHETRRFAAIVPVMQYGLAPAALAARRLGLPGTPPAAVERTANKLRMRQVLEQAGLGQVRYAGCDSPEQVEAFRREVGGPIVVKPMSGTGSDGVSRVDAAEEVAAAFELAATARGSSGVLCEEFIAGPEVSLEGYVTEGRLVAVAITDKLSDARFLELGHSQPSRHPPEAQAEAWRLAERALAALGMTHAMCHTEIRLSPRGPVIVETHPRIGGGWIHVLTALTTGVDLADVAVALALGEAPGALPRPTGVAAAVAFLPARAGTVSAVEMPPATGEVRRAGLGMFVKPGARLSGRSASWERLGQAVAVGATPEAALESATRYLRSVRIDFEEDRPRRLVFVGGVQIPELGRAARRRGFESVVLLGEEEDLPDLGRDFDHRERVDVDGPRSAVLRRILDLHETRRFAAVVPVLQYGLAPAALAARRLGLPGTPPAAVERTANKLRMRQVLEQAGL
ncbi:MAG TPA: ATP-grasp domain-containing protein, partial [Vicinamibacteria bacterium]